MEECFHNPGFFIFQKGGEKVSRNRGVRGKLRVIHELNAKAYLHTVFFIIKTTSQLDIPAPSETLPVWWPKVPEIAPIVIEVERVPIGGCVETRFSLGDRLKAFG